MSGRVVIQAPGEGEDSGEEDYGAEGYLLRIRG